MNIESGSLRECSYYDNGSCLFGSVDLSDLQKTNQALRQAISRKKELMRREHGDYRRNPQERENKSDEDLDQLIQDLQQERADLLRQRKTDKPSFASMNGRGEYSCRAERKGFLFRRVTPKGIEDQASKCDEYAKGPIPPDSEIL